MAKFIPPHSPTTEFQLQKLTFRKVTNQGFLLNAANRSLSHRNTIYTSNRGSQTPYFAKITTTLWIHLRLVTRFRVSVNIRPHLIYAFMSWTGTTSPFLQSIKDERNASLLIYPNLFHHSFREGKGDNDRYGYQETYIEGTRSLSENISGQLSAVTVGQPSDNHHRTLPRW